MAKKRQRAKTYQDFIEVSDSVLLKAMSWATWLIPAVFTWLLATNEPSPTEAHSIGSKAMVIVAFIACLAFSVYAVMALGRIEIGEGSIARVNFWGRFGLRWKDITRIEVDDGGYYVFYSNERYFGCPGPNWWSGHERWKAGALLEQKIRSQEIPVVRRAGALLKIARQTKVS